MNDFLSFVCIHVHLSKIGGLSFFFLDVFQRFLIPAILSFCSLTSFFHLTSCATEGG
jgi:hypothetical protein